MMIKYSQFKFVLIFLKLQYLQYLQLFTAICITYISIVYYIILYLVKFTYNH